MRTVAACPGTFQSAVFALPPRAPRDSNMVTLAPEFLSAYAAPAPPMPPPITATRREATDLDEERDFSAMGTLRSTNATRDGETYESMHAAKRAASIQGSATASAAKSRRLRLAQLIAMLLLG